MRGTPSEIKQRLDAVYSDLFPSYSVVKSWQNLSVWNKNPLSIMATIFGIVRAFYWLTLKIIIQLSTVHIMLGICQIIFTGVCIEIRGNYTEK